MKNLINKLNRWRKIPLFLRVLNSPFKPFQLKFYCGKTKLGTPLFHPRTWRKFTTEETLEAAHAAVNDPRKIKKTFNEWITHYENHLKAVPKKIGYDLVGLRWKMKYDMFRHETCPIWSFVFYGYQIAVMVKVEHPTQYWESFLAYRFDTDRSLSRAERVKECIKKYPCVWTSYSSGYPPVKTNYWPLILKKQYIYET